MLVSLLVGKSGIGRGGGEDTTARCAEDLDYLKLRSQITLLWRSCVFLPSGPRGQLFLSTVDAAVYAEYEECFTQRTWACMNECSSSC